MIPLEMLPQHVVGVQIDDVSRWVALSWVRPDHDAAGLVFCDIDVARVRLIMELRHEFNINDDAIPTVLSLLDQLYEARRQMRALRRALGTISPETADAMLKALPQ